ncbi:MAG TPA: helix-turn-helix domain-containing protein [Clostridia bacterium]|nr:helix-turn-helix domain-containing protein [Clostridia bacterium]
MDYHYFCETLSHLMGIPVRLYRSGKILHQCSNVEFSPDPVSLVLSDSLSSGQTVQFYESSLLFFGVIHAKKPNIAIIIGPTFSVRPGSDSIHVLMQKLGLPHEQMRAFRYYLDNIPTYPIESFLQVLCFIHYFFNKKKLSVSDLIVQNVSLASSQTERTLPPEVIESEQEVIHNTYQMEQQMLSYIVAGQPDALKSMFSGPPTGRVGRIAHDELRQLKNTFVCAATLASRSAIQGGVSHETAFAMSDFYIQKAELLNDYTSLTKLNMSMLIDFANHVEALKSSGSYSKHVIAAIRYVNKNINQKLSLDQIAGTVGISRTHLCAIFKLETGKTLLTYFTERKTTEAKRLLTTTDMPLGSISEYLGYSSQSHFQRVFRDQTGMTPLKYRNH